VSGLAPDREYWYRFTAGGHQSQAGHARTLPSARAQVAGLRMAVVCCQHYEHGHYAAYRHIAGESPDLVVHVGDYIYEGAPSASAVRQHTGGVCRTLDDYRARYTLYKADASLQAAHAAAAWLLTWDDHEVANDYSGRFSGRDEDPVVFLARRAAAYQAYFEHTPLPPSAAPRDGEMRIYTRQRIGQLATIHMLDQRQYRSSQACAVPGRGGGNRVDDACTERLDPARTMLGAEQERWFEQGLNEARSRWTVLAQGTVVTHMEETPGDKNIYWSDAWTGYPAARRRLIESMQRARSANPVVFSGDLHAFVVGDIHSVPEQLDSPRFAPEFATTSISSDARDQSVLDQWHAINANVQYLEGRKRGYLDVRLSDKRMQVDLVAIDDARQPDSGKSVAKSYVVEAGSPVIQPA
jgi:alkaline phosphatase D